MKTRSLTRKSFGKRAIIVIGFRFQPHPGKSNNDLFPLNSAWDKKLLNLLRTDLVPSGIKFEYKFIGARSRCPRNSCQYLHIQVWKPSCLPSYFYQRPFQSKPPIQVEIGSMPFLTYSAMVRLREVVICSDASVPTARFKGTPLSALPKPIEGAKAPTNQIAQKAHTLTSSENSQKSLYKSSKQTKRLTQKEIFFNKITKIERKIKKKKPFNSETFKFK